MGGDAAGLGENLLAAVVDRTSADRQRSGVERALAEFDSRRITFDDVDVVRPQAERVGGDLRIAGRVPLAVVSGADVHAHPAGRMHKHARVFPPAIRETDCGG